MVRRVFSVGFRRKRYRLSNPLNLTEGFLLYTSSLVPFFISGIYRYGRRPFELLYARRSDVGFFFWFMCFTFSVIGFPWILKLVWLLYLRLDFTHARILIVGLLPLSLIVSALLADMSPISRGQQAMDDPVVAILLAVLLVGGIEFISRKFSGSTLSRSCTRDSMCLFRLSELACPPSSLDLF